MGRNDRRYVGVRMTKEERAAYDEKLGKTIYRGKLFLLKLLNGDDLREKAPKEEREVHNQMFRIQHNCFQLWAGRNSPPGQVRVFYARYRYLEKVMADICDIVYLALLWQDE